VFFARLFFAVLLLLAAPAAAQDSPEPLSGIRETLEKANRAAAEGREDLAMRLYREGAARCDPDPNASVYCFYIYSRGSNAAGVDPATRAAWRAQLERIAPQADLDAHVAREADRTDLAPQDKAGALVAADRYREAQAILEAETRSKKFKMKSLDDRVALLKQTAGTIELGAEEGDYSQFRLAASYRAQALRLAQADASAPADWLWRLEHELARTQLDAGETQKGLSRLKRLLLNVPAEITHREALQAADRLTSLCSSSRDWRCAERAALVGLDWHRRRYADDSLPVTYQRVRLARIALSSRQSALARGHYLHAFAGLRAKLASEGEFDDRQMDYLRNFNGAYRESVRVAWALAQPSR
jgi:hypothetical protein